MKKILYVIALVAMFGICACEKQDGDDSSIVGTWVCLKATTIFDDIYNDEDDKESISWATFTSDGDYIIYCSNEHHRAEYKDGYIYLEGGEAGLKNYFDSKTPYQYSSGELILDIDGLKIPSKVIIKGNKLSLIAGVATTEAERIKGYKSL